MNEILETKFQKRKYRTKRTRAQDAYEQLVKMIAQKERLLADLQGQKDNAKMIIEMLKDNINLQFNSDAKTEARYKVNAAAYNLIKLFKLEKDLLTDIEGLYRKKAAFKL